MKKPIHLGIACGGTGGHFFPALAIAREFRRQGGQITLIIGGHHSEEQMALAQREGLTAVPADALRLPQHRRECLLFPFRFVAAVLRSRRLLKQLHPDVLLGMGSFASVPVGLAAACLRTPLVLHEGNTITGRANRFLSRWARRMATSFPEQANRTRTKCPAVWTGFPVRDEIVAAARNPFVPQEYLQSLHLDPALPLLLVFGGSQGARFINETTAQAAGLFGAEAGRRLQILHFSGEDQNEPLQEAYRKAGIRCVVKRNETAMHHAYLAAGLVVCRAGGATISELALFGRAALLIPLPSAAEDHQTANAQAAVRLGGAILSRQSDTTPETLAGLVREWLTAPQRCNELGQGLRRLAVPDASSKVVKLICDVLG